VYTAEEAREKAFEIKSRQHSKIYQAIVKEIDRQVKNGCFNAYIRPNFYATWEEDLNELVELGYEIEFSIDDGWHISW
jgi:hypothetical protein